MTTPNSQRFTQSRIPAATTTTLRLVPTTPAPQARAANGNDRSAAIAQLYATHHAALTLAARRYADTKADADDAVQEAFAILLASPTRAPTRSTLWAIVRDVCADRAAQLARSDRYVGEDDEGDDEVHPARTWLGKVFE
jgi:DNA-directed RNA polymerase specialized sigma24 family protein